MQVNPYLGFNGNCAEAFKFYEKALGGTIVMQMTYGESPEASRTPPEMKDRIMHVAMELANVTLMGGDAPPQMYSTPAGITVNLSVDTPAEAERLFNSLSDGATIRMPIGETFWAQRFGMLVDKFGTPWMVNCPKPM